MLQQRTELEVLLRQCLDDVKAQQESRVCPALGDIPQAEILRPNTYPPGCPSTRHLMSVKPRSQMQGEGKARCCRPFTVAGFHHFVPLFLLGPSGGSAGKSEPTSRICAGAFARGAQPQRKRHAAMAWLRSVHELSAQDRERALELGCCLF